jgi:hypothetical protein
VNILTIRNTYRQCQTVSPELLGALDGFPFYQSLRDESVDPSFWI